MEELAWLCALLVGNASRVGATKLIPVDATIHVVVDFPYHPLHLGLAKTQTIRNLVHDNCVH
jgi:hypothetical protein